MSRLVLLTLSLQALCAWAFVPSTSRWCRSAVIRSADVLEFGGDDDKPKELTADEKQEMLYCIGLNVATQFGDLPKLVSKDEMAPIIGAITDTLMGDVEGVPGERIQKVGNDLNNFLQGRMAGLVDAAKAEGQAALAAAAAEEGATQTASGLVYQEIKHGIGPKPTDGSTVQVHYHGTLIDGTVFDSSKARGEPAQFALKQVIAGWTEGLQLMGEGGVAKLTIPSDLAYGDGGQGATIPAGATLVFEIELIKVLSNGVGGLIL